MPSKYAVSRLVARDISRRNFGLRRGQLLDWIEAQPDEGIASDAVLGANGFSKDIDTLLVEAGRIYTEAVNNDELPTDGSGLPTGGAPGQALIKDEDNEPAWSDAPASTFRGEWAEDQVVFVENFDVGFGVFEVSKTGNARLPELQNNDNEAAGKPFTKRVRLWANPSDNLGDKSTLTLDVAELGLSKPLTRVSFWIRSGYNGFPQNGSFHIVTGTGTELYTRPGNENIAWTKQSTPIPSDVDELRFEHLVANTIGSGEAQTYLGGIELLAADAPYMLGHFVTYEGKMWRSIVNNNATTPGASAQWVEALTLPLDVGTTGQRPSAATAGAGFQFYDTTIKKPVWSDGANWTDATGTGA